MTETENRAMNRFKGLFPVSKPIIAMLHFAGDNHQQRVDRAIDEMHLYAEEGVDGVIFENYHGEIGDIEVALDKTRHEELPLIQGINLLGSAEYSYTLANWHNLSFIQFDNILNSGLLRDHYATLRRTLSRISTFGGVRFKYQPETGRTLEADIREGMSLYDVIVTTGNATGQETSIKKLREFRQHLQNFPFVVGAGVTLENVTEQLKYTDGAIVGSYFKINWETLNPVDRSRVRDFMQAVKEARTAKELV